MKFIIQLKTIEDIKRFRTKINGLKLQLIQFQAITVRKLAEQIILTAIHKKMRGRGFSEKIIKGTTLDNIELVGKNKIRLFFRSVYFSETGFDVAVAREEGTDRHFIKPKDPENGPKALHDNPEWPYFSKGHWVDGMIAFFIVKNTVREMTIPLQDEFNRQKILWFEKNLEGVAVAS